MVILSDVRLVNTINMFRVKINTLIIYRGVFIGRGGSAGTIDFHKSGS